MIVMKAMQVMGVIKNPKKIKRKMRMRMIKKSN